VSWWRHLGQVGFNFSEAKMFRHHHLEPYAGIEFHCEHPSSRVPLNGIKKA
jgi:hypothetical protein